MLISSSGVRVRGNRVSEALYGLVALDSHDNQIQGNVFYRNRENTVLLDSSQNRFAEDAYYRQDLQVYDEGGNHWAENYWDDYTGTDKDGDGRGDTPFEIGVGVFDLAPLMRPPNKPVSSPPELVRAVMPFLANPLQNIEGEQRWDGVRTLLGMVMIQPGGRLVIDDCMLKAAPATAGGDNIIWVRDGGVLSIRGSSLEGHPREANFSIRVDRGEGFHPSEQDRICRRLGRQWRPPDIWRRSSHRGQ